MVLRRRGERTTRGIALVAVLALAAAGCSGSSGEGSDDGAGDEAASTTAAAEETTTTTEAPVARSAGCGLAPDVEQPAQERPGDVELTFESGGVERIYRLGIPEGYDPDVPAPLLLNLHGSGSNALQASVYGDVPRLAGERGMVTVTPQGVDGQWQLVAAGTDATFLAELVDDVSARYCIDELRLHMIGMSLGAWKAASTACAEGRWASIALVTVEVFPGACEPMPVVAFHGTADPVVPYGEGGEPGIEVGGRNGRLPGVHQNMANWAESGGCDPEPAVERIGDDVERWIYEGCDEGVGVELYTIEGGGHTWPGADIDIADASMTTDTIDATEIALDWFEAHPRR